MLTIEDIMEEARLVGLSETPELIAFTHSSRMR